MTFLVEDAPQRSLLRSLGIPRKSILVMGAKGNVIKKLKDRPGDVGIVDEDPDSIQTQSHELANYPVVERGEGLQLRARRGGGGQRLIVLCPRVERWLIDRAGACEIDPRQYGLPSTARELENLQHYEEKDGFGRFLDELRDRDIGLLRRWVPQEGR
ncbi:MAG: hypothetical protein JW955_23685 [Sedimentisphaerales bacterium]|nr:hypothetical protein [Sedimentisphaerales bacterium]